MATAGTSGDGGEGGTAWLGGVEGQASSIGRGTAEWMIEGGDGGEGGATELRAGCRSV
jgi:hypothetical protein